MACEYCIELEAKCPICKETELDDIRRRARGSKKYRKAFISPKFTKCQRCKCCTNLQIASVYMRCPPDMYIGHKVSATQGGEHCVKNLHYFPKIPGQTSNNEL